MHEPEKASPAELAFQLGKIARRAVDHADGKVGTAGLAAFANDLLEAGEGKVASELLMIFVAGFEEGDPPERRAHPEDR
jgi:hypothetical protein